MASLWCIHIACITHCCCFGGFIKLGAAGISCQSENNMPTGCLGHGYEVLSFRSKELDLV